MNNYENISGGQNFDQTSGAIRTMDEFGRIIIPKIVRERMCLLEGDQFEIVTQGTQIIFIRHEPKCFVCEDDINVQKVGRGYLCEEHREMVEEIIA